uniref:Uncharacterized protein n=1 Tax=Lactuca sativa TaxID=4236 RepID=A0A9R1URQ3_LACSA|nr:hypothetical protein LSAT_V11C800442750 [Lactuca sativa]
MRAFCLVPDLWFRECLRATLSSTAQKVCLSLCLGFRVNENATLCDYPYFTSYSRDFVADILDSQLRMNIFHSYPRGRAIWDLSYRQLSTIFDKIDEHVNPIHPRPGIRPTYTMQTFPNSRTNDTPTPAVIPQIVAYPRMRNLLVDDCLPPTRCCNLLRMSVLLCCGVRHNHG